MAVSYGHTELLEILLRKGASLKVKDIHDKNAVFLAAEENNEDTLRVSIATSFKRSQNRSTTAVDETKPSDMRTRQWPWPEPPSSLAKRPWERGCLHFHSPQSSQLSRIQDGG